MAGDFHSLAVGADGTLWSWGWDFRGQLGTGQGNTVNTVPAHVINPDGSMLGAVIAVDGGSDNSVALRSNGDVAAWGENSSGQLGNGTFGSARLRAVRVDGLTDVRRVDNAADFMLALRADGTVWGVGANETGELGDGTAINRAVPVMVLNLQGVRAIANGGIHSLALIR
jgi:alpha-tubulin suppressor-like RCC1 family protein